MKGINCNFSHVKYSTFVMVGRENNVKKTYHCSWWENEPSKSDLYKKIEYIGVTNGLGGYNQLIKKGFYDRRFFKQATKTELLTRYMIREVKKPKLK